MIKNILKKIPGFRTGGKWKMLTAIIVYPILIIGLFNPIGITPRDKIIDTITYLILIGIPFVLITNLGSIRSKLPIFKKNTIKSNILGTFITLLIIFVGFGAINELKTPGQKEIDLARAEERKEISDAKKVSRSLNKKIKKLGNADSITLDKEDYVLALRKEYEELSLEEKEHVKEIKLLEMAEERIADMKMEIALDLNSKIKEIGNIEVSELNEDDQIKSLRNIYEDLSPEVKKLVVNIEILEAAEKQMEDLKKISEKKELEGKIKTETEAVSEKKPVECHQKEEENAQHIIGSTRKQVKKLLTDKGYKFDKKYTENVDANAMDFEKKNVGILVYFDENNIAEGVYVESWDGDILTGEGSYVSLHYDDLISLTSGDKNISVTNDLIEFTDFVYLEYPTWLEIGNLPED